MGQEKQAKITLLILLLGLGLLTNLPSQAKSFPSTLATGNTLFMQKFQGLYDYVHYALNTTDFSLMNYNFTNAEYNPSRERWNVVTFAWLLTYAYEHTGDTKYLHEAKWIVDNLESYLNNPTDKTLIIYPRNTFSGWLWADALHLWTKTRLNEFYGQTYDTASQITYIFSKATVSNSTDIGWDYRWVGGTPDSPAAKTPNPWVWFMAYLAYLKSKGLGDYTSQLQRIYHRMNRAYVEANGFYKYSIDDAAANSQYSAWLAEGLLVTDYFQSGIVNATKLQATINRIQYGVSANFVDYSVCAISGVAEMAISRGYTLNQRLRTALYQMLEENPLNDGVVSSANGTGVFGTAWEEGMRYTLINRLNGFLVPLAITGSTDRSSYYNRSYYVDDQSAAAPKYILGNAFDWNTTFLEHGKSGVYQGFRGLTNGHGAFRAWNGWNAGFDSFAWNNTYEYFQGYKYSGITSIGTWVKVRAWENLRKAEITHLTPNTDVTNYWDGIAYTDGKKSYLRFTNGTVYNVTAVTAPSTLTLRVSNPFLLYETDSGRVGTVVYSNNASSMITLVSQATSPTRRISIRASNITMFFNTLAVQDLTIADTYNYGEAKALRPLLLSNAVNGTDRKNTLFSMPEGNAQYKIKHFSNPSQSIYTSQTLDSASYANDKLTMSVSASSGATSTTKIYSSQGKPKVIDPILADGGWNENTKTQTLTWIHSSAVTFNLRWAIESSGKYSLNVFVLKDSLPVQTSVLINGENKSTSLLGLATWQLPYGTYEITVSLLGYPTQTSTILLNQDTTKTFNFTTPPPNIKPPNILSIIGMGILVVAIAATYLFLFRRRRH